jgi:hypothetical protein
MRLLAIVLLSCSCATSRTALSDACQRQRDLCVNACPGVAPGSPSPTPPELAGRHETQPAATSIRNARYDWLANCVLDCETAARNCH